MSSRHVEPAAFPARLPPSEVVFWTGAGISAEPPAAQPLGFDLTRWLLDWCTPPGTLGRIQEIYREGRFTHLRAERVKELPRLEMLLQCAWWVMGLDAYGAWAACMQVSQPNRFHQYFAEHLRRGGTHVTLNLDGGIEHAFAPTAPTSCPRAIPGRFGVHGDPPLCQGLRGRLLKIHGSLLDGDPLDDLGLLLHGIGSGFEPDLAEALVGLLHRTQHLIFVGYGGVDGLDVTPFFLGLPARNVRLDGLAVSWIEHGRRGGVREAGHDGPVILAALEACGARTRYIADGRTAAQVLLDIEALDGLVFPPAPRPEPGSTPWWRGPRPAGPSGAERHLIAAQIYSALGVGPDALRHAEACLEDRQVALDLAWVPDSAGRYPNDLRALKVRLNALCNCGFYRQAGRETERLRMAAAGDQRTAFLLGARTASELRLAGEFDAARREIPFLLDAIGEALAAWKRCAQPLGGGREGWHIAGDEAEAAELERAARARQMDRRTWVNRGMLFEIVQAHIALGRLLHDLSRLGCAWQAAEQTYRTRHADVLAIARDELGELASVANLARLSREFGLPVPECPDPFTLQVEIDSLLGEVNEARRRLLGLPRGAERRARVADLLRKCRAIGDHPGAFKAAFIGALDAWREGHVWQACAYIATAWRLARRLEVRWSAWLRLQWRLYRAAAHGLRRPSA